MPIDTNYQNYNNPYAGNTSKSDKKVDSEGNVIDAVFADPNDQQVSVDDFLQLMISQLKNQDFMNPVDDTQYITQLAQFTSMQQMQEMAYNSKTTFLTSLVGKTVVAARMAVGGGVKRTEGVVDKISFVNNEFKFSIGDQTFDVNQIMEVKPEPKAPMQNAPESESDSDREEQS